jgi:two-component system LytT family response regulator
MKINTIIVDDEKNSREVLRTLLEKFCPDVIIIGEASNVAEAYDLISISKPDLIFLDIQMPWNNGFSLLKKFNPIPFSVIFVTSYDHYAITAIKFSAIDYLLKPVEITDLKSAVTKAISKKKEVDHYVVHLLNNIDEQAIDKKIPVHVQGSVRFINTCSITHIEADGAYSTIFCNGEKLLSSKSLKEFEEFLKPNLHFIRINKSIIVNIQFLKGYTKGDPFIITLMTGDVFESSRRRKLDVLERLKQFT